MAKNRKRDYPRISIRLSDKLQADLESLATKNARKKSEYARMILAEHVRNAMRAA